MKKYELLKTDCIEAGGKKLYRIKALRSFSNVNKGDLGGYIVEPTASGVCFGFYV